MSDDAPPRPFVYKSLDPAPKPRPTIEKTTVDRPMSFFEELKELFRGPLDLIPLTNAAVYSLGFSIFGVSAWKCVVVGIGAFAASKRYGRRVVSRLGVLVMIASAFVWTGLTPDIQEMARTARAVVAEFYP
jgi:hypothetical protein